MTTVIPVRLGDRSYEVRIGEGIIAAAGEHLRDIAGGRVFVVTDETVERLHGGALARGLAAAGLDPAWIVVAPGEQTKSFAGLADLCERLLEARIERRDLVLAFGGGVVGDLAGFAAAVIKRGIDCVQVPTTLLAQVDSSVGGKTAIDTPQGKNLVGAFHQPRRVLADIGALASLPRRERACGLAEILKIALALDEGFFTWLEAHVGGVLAGEREATGAAVARAVALKAAIVADDEHERPGGRRALLNLGHTFGHALEAQTGYGAGLKHGEAVGLGCVLATRFAAERGQCPAGDIARVERVIAAAGLPIGLPANVGAEGLVNHMTHDKKARDGGLTLILPGAVGAAFVALGVEPASVRAFLVDQGAPP